MIRLQLLEFLKVDGMQQLPVPRLPRYFYGGIRVQSAEFGRDVFAGAGHMRCTLQPDRAS